VVGLVAMCMLGAAAVAVAIGSHDRASRAAQGLVVAFLAAALAGGIVFYSRRLRSWIQAGRLLRRLPFFAMMQRVQDALFVYRYHTAQVALSVAYSWAVQAGGVLAMWWIGMGLESGARWYHYFVNMPIIWIGWSFIPVPGGFGVAETLSQKLFNAAILGKDLTPVQAATLALAMILAYRVIQMVASLPGGVLYLVRPSDVSAERMREAMESEAADA
jgi:hypothetical protein